jgi:SAM-dependent methyltransferase
MTPAERTREHKRIRAVYAHYDSSDAEQRKRDSSNPGNRLNGACRWAALRQAIIRLDLRAGVTILDVGCGSGGDLQHIAEEFNQLRPMLHGVDLLPDRIEQARKVLPHATLRVAGGEQLEYDDRFFDVVLAATVFSSILDGDLACRMASEMTRVAGNSGVILCYDMRYPNPWNPHVRPIRRRDLRDLFPRARMQLTPVTLLPPLARSLGNLTATAYRPLHAVRLLRSHYLAEIRPNQSSAGTG